MTQIGDVRYAVWVTPACLVYEAAYKNGWTLDVLQSEGAIASDYCDPAMCERVTFYASLEEAVQKAISFIKAEKDWWGSAWIYREIYSDLEEFSGWQPAWRRVRRWAVSDQIDDEEGME